MLESAWGWLIVTYLFLAGVGSGAFLSAAASRQLAPDWSQALARAGALISGPLVAIGTTCLVLDLEAGLWEPWRQIYLVFNPRSMITWGVIILSAFIPVAFLYAAALCEITFVGRYAKRHVRLLEVVGSILAVATAGYTGVLIAVINGVPFWNTPLLPVLFLVSAVSTGFAAAAITAAFIDKGSIKGMSNFAMGHMIFLAAEGIVLMLFLFMSITRSDAAAASAGMLISGPLSLPFWILVVVLGIAIPLLVSVIEYYEYGELSMSTVLATDFLVLIGGVSLRAVIIYSGQPPVIL